jgi:two-component system alkaline phosphatase synthesis response regulator PhoP
MTKSILLCDDEIHILRALEFKFKRDGYEVRVAADGEEAWEKILQSKPDVLVADCQMPRLDGLGLIRRIRQHEATRDLRVLLLTAKGYELSSESMLRQWNVIRVLSKPFSPRELVAIVDALLADGGQGPGSRRQGTGAREPGDRERTRVRCSVSLPPDLALPPPATTPGPQLTTDNR